MPAALLAVSDVALHRQRNARLLRASKTYAQENRLLSWFHLWSALILFIALIAVSCPSAFPWLVRIPASLLAGLVLVRLFIIYHDYEHGTILKGSRLASWIMGAYGLITLNPPNIWNLSHNHHHKHNAKILGASIGSFPVMTVTAYARAPWQRRLLYAISRHPLTIGAGYVTVFFYGMCIRSLLADPKAHLGSALSLLTHGGLVVALAIWAPDKLVLALIVPSTVASAIGSYLFYAQHNYPTVTLQDRAAWDYVGAALQSSSYIRMGPIMGWLTGNIGYHHVHHLNARIPFYRLPEAMAAMSELQSPGTTSLSLRDIFACLRLKLWDAKACRMVGFAAARNTQTQEEPAIQS